MSDSLRKTLFYVTVLAIALRVGFLLYLTATNPQTFVGRDSLDYVLPARGLLATGEFAVDGQPEILRTPGYPVFLIPFLVVFGEAWIPAVISAHFVLAVGIAMLTYWMVRSLPVEFASNRAAAIAYIIILFEPNLFLMQFTVGTEILFTFLLSVSILLLIRGIGRQWPLALMAGVVLMTASAYVRPVALYLPYVVLLTIGLYFLLKKRWRLLAPLVVGVVIHHAAVGAWESRNERLFGVSTFTTITEHNLYEYIGAAVLARAEDRDWNVVRSEFQERKEAWPLNEAEKAERSGRIARDIILEHPVSAFAIGLRGLAVNAFDPGTGQLANRLELRQPGSGIIYRFNNMPVGDFFVYLVREEIALLSLMGIGMVWILIHWGGAVFAVIRVPELRGTEGWILILAIGYLLIVTAGPQSLARFRGPAIPFITVFTAFGLNDVWRLLKIRRAHRRTQSQARA